MTRHKDIRVFYSEISRAWIVANDKKLKKLMDKGFTYYEAKERSHGHMNNEKSALEIKENILNNKRTNKRDLWTLGCYKRVADDSYKYYKWTVELLETKIRKGPKEQHVRINKGLVT